MWTGLVHSSPETRWRGLLTAPRPLGFGGAGSQPRSSQGILLEKEMLTLYPYLAMPYILSRVLY